MTGFTIEKNRSRAGRGESRSALRLVRLLCAAAAVLALTACGNQLPDPTPTPPAETAQTIPTLTPRPAATPAPAETPVPTPTPEPMARTTAFEHPGTAYAAMPEVMADTGLSQNAKIQLIRDWYYAAENPSAGLESLVYDDTLTSFWDNGKLVRLDVTEQLDAASPDGDGVTYHYYYHDGMPYFAYILDYGWKGSQLRLYFWNGELIRWIESDGIIHNTGNEDYARYCDGAWRLYQIMTNL